MRSVPAVFLQTDLDGEVSVSTDGNDVGVSTFTGRAWELIRGATKNTKTRREEVT